MGNYDTDPFTASTTLYTFLLLLALILSLLSATTTLSNFTTAYLSAPTDLSTYLSIADSSIQENESHDNDIAKLQRLDDKLRLGQSLREIQKCSDDLREELNRLLVDDGMGRKSPTRLRASTRLLWATKRKGLEERVRRLDMLRMRFLVVYMGLVANKAVVTPQDPEKLHGHSSQQHHHYNNGGIVSPKTAPLTRPGMPHALSEAITATKKQPPVSLRRITTQAMGHMNRDFGANTGQRAGWADVVGELQRSPLMHKRHASIDAAMSVERRGSLS